MCECVNECVSENELLCLYRAFVIFGLRHFMALLFLKEEKTLKIKKKHYKSTFVSGFLLKVRKVTQSLPFLPIDPNILTSSRNQSIVFVNSIKH